MSAFTLHDLQCFDAVARTGGFQTAADALHRSHPAVHAAVSKLERQLGLRLLDRSGYRVSLTEAGASFHRRAQVLLQEMHSLQVHAQQLAMGEESELRVVIGDFCPRREVLTMLGAFGSLNPHTRLHLHAEAVGGPLERLLADEADLILHTVNKSDPRLEWLDLCAVPFVPVAAPGFLGFAESKSIRPEQLRPYTQCIIRDTARQANTADYFMIAGAHQCTVADQLMKKEIILQGMAWGHMPRFLVAQELRDGALLSLAGRYLPGSVEALVAARRSDRPHGPAAQRLWMHLQQAAAQLHLPEPL
ncbi:LysR family transcriptional regulator [Massilia sp. YIM B04103]|uniref:LysR family transcriptional regulator n=1 Tax=Massilia sp. YIM B04103 TaxID=2963106 RepID=UPI0021090B92|nr:LysR family transcriptional regulator [Massilia sp. YIM B04103]